MLTKSEIVNILNRAFCSLQESIKTIHFNEKYPEWKNILITNLKDNNAYIFDGVKFIAINKNEILDELISLHMSEIETNIDKHKKYVEPYKLCKLYEFLKSYNENEKDVYYDEFNKTYPNYRLYKQDIIKYFIYNNTEPKLLDKLKSLELINKDVKYLDLV